MSLLSALSCYASDDEADSANRQPAPPSAAKEDPSASSSLPAKRTPSEDEGRRKRGRSDDVTSLRPPQLGARPNVVTEDHRKR